MFGLGAGGLWAARDLYYLGAYALTFAIAIVSATPLGTRLFSRMPAAVRESAAPVLIAMVLILATAYTVDGTYNPFLYFKF